MSKQDGRLGTAPEPAALHSMTYDPSGDLLVIDLRSGDVCHWLRVEGMVRELYDVAVLPGVVRPMALGFKTEEIQRTIAMDDEESL